MAAGAGAAAAGAGLLFNIAGGLLQKKPGVAKFTPVDLAREQRSAIDANQAALPGLQKLGSEVNTYNQDEMLKALRRAIPNYDELVKKSSGNINNLLSGIIPQDVQNQIQNSAAAKAIGGGYAGSGMHRNLLARDLGLTSLDLTQKGLDSASRWISQTAALTQPNQFNISSMFISPTQQAQVTAANNAGQQAYKNIKNQVDAAYSWQTIVGQSLQEFGGQLGSMGSMGGGGGGVHTGSEVNWNYDNASSWQLPVNGGGSYSGAGAH